jgi:hypothetical protein
MEHAGGIDTIDHALSSRQQAEDLITQKLQARLHRPITFRETRPDTIHAALPDDSEISYSFNWTVIDATTDRCKTSPEPTISRMYGFM